MNFKKSSSLILLIIFSYGCKAQKSTFFVDSENITIKEAFKFSDNITPGCIKGEQFQLFKKYLKNIYGLDLENEKIINIFYVMPKSKCGVEYKKKEKKNISNEYFLSHSNEYTKLKNSILFIQNELNEYDKSWFYDKNNLVFDLFLSYENDKKCTAQLTISNDGLFFLNWGYFNPLVYNAFSNAIPLYECQ